MNYEKEYKEAFKRAERRFDHNPTDGYAGYANGIIEDIFPQFIKREDERTRKEILDFIKRFWADHKESIPRISSWLVWLEKQKECVTDSSETAANEDERIRKGLIEALKASKTVGELKFIFPEPTREECIAYLEKQKEQKPAEWSEEDRDRVAQYLHDRDGGMLWSKATEITSDILDMLRPRSSWKPSEDEERLINTSISFLKDFADKGYENAVECIDWLKSLRNRVGKEFLQPHWKPTEEQMKALLKVVDKARELHYSSNSGYDEYDVLRSLYKQLEKLI